MRVIRFFILMMCFAGLLLFLQVLLSGSFTGFAFRDEIFSYGVTDSGLEIRIEKAQLKDSSLRVYYSVSDDLGKGALARVIAQVSDEDSAWLVQSEQTITLPAVGAGQYIFNIVVPDYEREQMIVSLVVDEGERNAFTEKLIYHASSLLSGFVVASEHKKSFRQGGIIFLVVVLVFGVSFFLYRHHQRLLKYKHHESYVKPKFISLNLEK